MYCGFFEQLANKTKIDKFIEKNFSEFYSQNSAILVSSASCSYAPPCVESSTEKAVFFKYLRFIVRTYWQVCIFYKYLNLMKRTTPRVTRANFLEKLFFGFLSAVKNATRNSKEFCLLHNVWRKSRVLRPLEMKYSVLTKDCLNR